MEVDREAVARRMRSTAPRCLRGFAVEPAQRPEPWEGRDIAAWRLTCPCGGSEGAFLGYPLSRYNPRYVGDAFACPGCGGKRFAIVASFFYWPAAVDLIEDEPERFLEMSQNLFCEFVAHGHCAGCRRTVRFTDFGKL